MGCIACTACKGAAYCYRCSVVRGLLVYTIYRLYLAEVYQRCLRNANGAMPSLPTY